MEKRQICFYLVLLSTAIARVNLAPMICTMPNSPEKGQCVSLQECTSLRVSSDFANPDIFREISDRSESCRSVNSKMVCCEDHAIASRVEESTSKTTTSTTTTSIAPPQALGLPLTVHRNYKQFDNNKCGLTIADRIANGENAGLLQFPWAARLGYITEGQIKYLCGATLITEYYVLTAAHCLVYLRGGFELKTVRLGEYDESTAIDCIDEYNCADPVQDIDAESFVPHPEYSRKTFVNDIGLVRLASAALTSQNNIKPICMPFDSNAKRVGIKYIIIGWGATENSTRSSVLQKVLIPEYDSLQCEQKFAEQKKIEITSGQFCAGGEAKIDACKGDSGSSLQSPALINMRPQMVQYGIVSFGVRYCGTLEGFPGIYTKVTSYLNWILDNMH